MSLFFRKPRQDDEHPSAYFARGLPRGPLVRQLQYLHEIFMFSDLARSENENFLKAFEFGLESIAVHTQALEQWRYHPDSRPNEIEVGV